MSSSETTNSQISNEQKLVKLNEEKQLEENCSYFTSLVDGKELTETVWGTDIKQDNFERWSQGFIFENKKEPTALLQYSGGPCAVIAAVQAFLLKELMFCTKCGDDWRHCDETELNMHLTDSLLSVFINVSSETPKYLVFYENVELNDSNSDSTASNSKRAKLDYDAFTKKLKVYKFDSLNSLKKKLIENINEYKQEYGVLCFLYSLLLTKRLDILKKELEESGESLINSLHGHGSQCLINLMLCGIATSNVFDGDKELDGLKLLGIPKQSTIGFLTIMEYLHYCEVGWHLKNPKWPIWLLASETHLSVFFSNETCLIQKNESSRQIAIKKFQKYDPYGIFYNSSTKSTQLKINKKLKLENGFVRTEDLAELMASLDLLTDQEYVDVIKQQLDTENLGIITKSAFLNEFYPESEPNYIPDKFTVYHYNGLARSNHDNEVQYSKGLARIIDFTDQPSLDVNSIKNCLQSKWPTIEIEWEDATRVPSLN